MKAGADRVPCWRVPAALSRWLVLSHNFSRTNLPISSFSVGKVGGLLVLYLFCAKGSHVGRVPCVMSLRSPAWSQSRPPMDSELVVARLEGQQFSVHLSAGYQETGPM